MCPLINFYRTGFTSHGAFCGLRTAARATATGHCVGRVSVCGCVSVWRVRV